MKVTSLIKRMLLKSLEKTGKAVHSVAKHINPEFGKKVASFFLAMLAVVTLASCDIDEGAVDANSNLGSDVKTEIVIDWESQYKELYDTIQGVSDKLEDLENSFDAKTELIGEYQIALSSKMGELASKYEELNKVIKNNPAAADVEAILKQISIIEKDIDGIVLNVEKLQEGSVGESLTESLEEIKQSVVENKNTTAKLMILDSIERTLKNGYYGFTFDGMSVCSAKNGEYGWFNEERDRCIIYSNGIEHRYEDGNVYANFNDNVELITEVSNCLNLDLDIVDSRIDGQSVFLNYANGDNLTVRLNYKGEVTSVVLVENGIEKTAQLSKLDKATFELQMEFMSSTVKTYQLYNTITKNILSSYEDNSCLKITMNENDKNQEYWQIVNGVNKAGGYIDDNVYAVSVDGKTISCTTKEDGSVEIQEADQLATNYSISGIMKSLNYSVFNQGDEFTIAYDSETEEYVIKCSSYTSDEASQIVRLLFDENNNIDKFTVEIPYSNTFMTINIDPIKKSEFNSLYQQLEDHMAKANLQLGTNK